MRQLTRPDVPLLSLAVAFVAIVVAAGVFTLLAAGPVAANHGDDAGNYTVVLPEDSDHLPGDQNEANASMQNFAQAGDRFETDGAPNGFETLDYLETGNPEIDYSECGSANTAVFGIDRGNNNTGTQADTDLLQHMKESRFKENGIEVVFYEEEDFGGDPTHINPEDAIVSVQGAGSSAGPCFTMPTEPGWYQVTGFIEGTTADGETVRVESNSHYFPICEGCHDEETAEEELGAPPSQQSETDDDDATPTPTPTPEPDTDDTDEDDTQQDDADEDDTTPTPTATLTPESEEDDTQQDDGDVNDAGTDDDSDTDGGAADDGDDGPMTPAAGDGAGFGPVLAIIALLASALLAYRRQ